MEDTTKRTRHPERVTVSGKGGIEHLGVVGISGRGKTTLVGEAVRDALARGALVVPKDSPETTLDALRRFDGRTVLGFQSIEEVQRAYETADSSAVSKQSAPDRESAKRRLQRAKTPVARLSQDQTPKNRSAAGSGRKHDLGR